MNTDVRWVRVVVSITLAAFLWVSVKLTRNYNTTLEVPVRYVNLPTSLKLTQPLPTRLKLTVTGRGHRLFLPSIRIGLDSLEVDMLPHLEKGYLPTARLLERVNQMLPEQTMVTNIDPDTLPIRVAERIRKRVPILARFRVQPAPGYQLETPPVLKPDSVWVTGTAAELNTLRYWPTVDTVLQAVNADGNFTIRLLPNRNVVADRRSVTATVNVTQYTERTFRLTPGWMGPSQSYQLRLVPETVTLTCQVPFDRYDQLTEADFVLQVRLPDPEPNKPLPPYVTPEVVRQPIYVRQVRIEPKYLRYVITR